MNLSFSLHGKYISSQSLYKYNRPAFKSSLDHRSILISPKPQKDTNYKKQQSLKLRIKPKPKRNPSSQSRTIIKNLFLPSTPPSSQFSSFRFFNHQISSGSIWSINHQNIRNSYLASKPKKIIKQPKPVDLAKPKDLVGHISRLSPLSPQIPRVEIKYKLKKVNNFPKS